MSLRAHYVDVLAVGHITIGITKNPEVRKYLHEKIKNLVENDAGFKLLIDRMAYRYNVSEMEAAKSALIAILDPENLKE